MNEKISILGSFDNDKDAMEALTKDFIKEIEDRPDFESDEIPEIKTLISEKLQIKNPTQEDYVSDMDTYEVDFYLKLAWLNSDYNDDNLDWKILEIEI